MSAVAEALTHLDEVIDALTLNGWQITPDGREVAMSPLECSLADDVERMASVMRASRDTPCALDPIAAELRRALVAAWQAREALREMTA